MLAYLIVVFLQVLILFGVGYALFQMPLGQSPLALLLLTLALGLASTSLGMMLGALCRTSKQADRWAWWSALSCWPWEAASFPSFAARA